MLGRWTIKKFPPANCGTNEHRKTHFDLRRNISKGDHVTSILVFQFYKSVQFPSN